MPHKRIRHASVFVLSWRRLWGFERAYHLLRALGALDAHESGATAIHTEELNTSSGKVEKSRNR